MSDRLSPLDVAEMWYELMTTDIDEAICEQHEKTEKGLNVYQQSHLDCKTGDERQDCQAKSNPRK